MPFSQTTKASLTKQVKYNCWFICLTIRIRHREFRVIKLIPGRNIRSYTWQSLSANSNLRSES